MALEKLTITLLPTEGEPLEPISVLFNPTSYSITKTVLWEGQRSVGHNAPLLTFGGGGSRELSLELFYDVTEPVAEQRIDDVRDLTNKLVALARIKPDLERPPVISISWGDGSQGKFNFPFVGVITSLTQNFTLFSSAGKPLRATISLKVLEFLDWMKDELETDPELTTRLVKRGDSLSSIAYEVYRDPTRWRVIAEANRIDDPRHLTIGLRLEIPKMS
jgi:hypothetical protein